MELDRAEAIVTELLAPGYLSPPQKMVFRAAWEGQSYRALAVAAGYEFNYIKGVGAQVWKILATATNTKVSKLNFRQVLESLDRIEPPAIAAVESSQSQIDWIEDLDISAFYGRELECNKLHQWIAIDRCRVVAILGMGGMGKTTMAIELLRELPSTITADADRFSCILWRSLLNAPPLKELLPELIDTLATSLGQIDRIAESQIVAADLHLKIIPKTVTGQIDLLLEICQQYRCLLVLDNGESIFQAGAQVGQYRAGYADYGDLFSTLGRMTHQSCLVLTSREKPTQISQLEGVNAKVRTLTLPGLDDTSGQQIFVDRGCKPVEQIEWAEVNRYCGGNPLALQLIAATVQEVADGDVSEIFPYLRSSKLGFADIHVLLEQQWERLTIEEHQVMYWLAIAREPLASVDLEAGLHSAGNRRQNDSPSTPVDRQAVGHSFLLSTLQSLRRRSIISISGTDRHKQQWSLQPMVMEYVTGVFVARICTEIEQQQPFLLNTHPIAQANAKEYIRQAQLRLIVQPAIDRLRNSIGNPAQIGKHLRRILTDWQITNPLQLGYLTGNSLNLLTYLKQDLTDLDCSELVVQQAYLVGIDLAGVNFTNAQMVDCAFTQTFSSILAIAYSPDGRTLAASDSNGEIRLWSVSDGQCVLTCAGHTNWVRAIEFSPDGKYLASSSDDRTIKLWDLEDGGCQQTIGRGIHSLGLSFSPDGLYIASGSANNTIYYWDTQTGSCVRQFEGHQNWSMDVQVHPQGHQLASGGADGTVRIWDVASGRCDRIWSGHQNWVTTIDYSPDGKTILSGSLDSTLRLWDATGAILADSDSQLVLTEHGDEIWSAVFSPNGAYFASAGVGGLLRIWRTADGYCLHRLEGHSERLWSVAFHPDGHRLASGGEDRAIRLWQVSDGKCLQALNGYTNCFRSIVWSPDGQRLITASRDALIRVWSPEPELCLHQLSGHTKSTLSVAYDPQGETFASGSDDRTIRIWDPQTLTCRQILRGHSAAIIALVYSPDGKYLVSGGSDFRIGIWDTQHWRCLYIRSGHTDRIGGLAYHPTRNLIASASEDRTVRIWRLHDDTPVHILSGHINRAIAVAFDPRGTILATGGMDSQILLWNIETGTLCHTLTGHDGWILSLAYSPDGRWLFSGASDHTIKVWSMESGLCTDTLIRHQSWVWSVSVSSCGRFLASASEDETLRIWDLTDNHLLSTRRARRPYEGMNITGVEGLTKAQIDDLKTLGAKGR